MKTNGQLFYRVSATLVMVLLVLFAAQPGQKSVNAAVDAFQSDDFNRCSLDTSIWTYENPAGLPATSITGQYQGDSTLTITVPAGKEVTFSNKNKNAPRIMQPAADEDFEFEVKFNSPLTQPATGYWNIQGILIKDTNNKWLRFDLDSNNASVNYYIGYVDENGVLQDIQGPSVLSATSFTTSPLYLKVKYVKATGQWSFGYRLGGAGSYAYKKVYTEATIIPGGITFDVAAVGVFAGTTSSGSGTNTPGITSQVDYVKMLTNTTFVDDANTLTVQKVGAGNVNWPMTSPSQCSGNTVSLTASPASGGSFVGWTGSGIDSALPTINLDMIKSYALTATFGSAPPIDFPFKWYMPFGWK